MFGRKTGTEEAPRVVVANDGTPVEITYAASGDSCPHGCTNTPVYRRLAKAALAAAPEELPTSTKPTPDEY